MACRTLKERGVSVGLRHCCNSGAILAYPEMQMDMVRPGIILYGLSPSDDLRDRADLRPVMTLCSRIAMIKTVGRGIPVSYRANLYHRAETACSNGDLRLCRRLSPGAFQSCLHAGRGLARSGDRADLYGSDDAGCDGLP